MWILFKVVLVFTALLAVVIVVGSILDWFANSVTNNYKSIAAWWNKPTPSPTVLRKISDNPWRK